MSWRIQDAHHWMMTPHTVYERRRELRVREMRQTAIAWDRKYQDIDTGKYKLDKMPAIAALGWQDVIEPEVDYVIDTRHTRPYVPRLLPVLPEKFVPKDNDFDEECRRDEVKVQNNPLGIFPIAPIAPPHDEAAYQERLAKREVELLASQPKRICDSIRMLPMMNVRPNSWRPK